MARRTRDEATLVRFEARNDAQKSACRLARDHDILFLIGPAGSGKTACAIGLALEYAAAQGERVAVCRPAVAASATLGYAKGDVGQKYAPWAAPVMESARRFVLGDPSPHIEMLPMEYVQGRTLKYAVLDEAQNCTVFEIESFLTRLAVGGKFFIAGDPEQAVVKGSGLAPWAAALEGLAGVACVTFPPGQSMRSPLVEAIIQRRPR